MGSIAIYRAAAGLVHQHLPNVRNHAAMTVWSGPDPLPSSVIEYFREFGVLDQPLPAGGVPHRFWQPAELQAIQTDWSTRIDGSPDPRWTASWLVLISEGSLAWAIDRDTDAIILIDGRSPIEMPCSLPELVAILVAAAVAHRQLDLDEPGADTSSLLDRSDALSLALAAQLLGRFGPVREVLPRIG